MIEKLRVRTYILFLFLLLTLQFLISARSLAGAVQSEKEPNTSIRLFDRTVFSSTTLLNNRLHGSSNEDLGNAQGVEAIGHLGGATLAVTVNENIAFVGEGPALAIFDVSNKTAPIRVGKSLPLPGILQDIAIAGNYAYVAVAPTYASSPVADSGLSVIDISDLTAPVGIGFYETYMGARGVAAAGNHAYVVDGDALHIVDVSVPTAPTRSAVLGLPGHERDVVLSGSYAYVIDGDGEGENEGLQIINVSDPADPQVTTTYTMSGTTEGLDLVGNDAYVASSTGLHVIDISTPATPSEAGSFTPQAYNMVSVAGDYAYVGGGSRLHFIDISDLSDIEEVGDYNLPPWAVGLDAAGSYVYLADAGLKIVNVSDPAQPTDSSFYRIPAYAHGVDQEGNYAYLADGHALHVIDISDSSDPTATGYFDAQGLAYKVAVSGDYAYVPVETGGGLAWGMRIVNVSNPASPFETGYYPGTSDAYGKPDVVGNYVFLADGLHIVNVSDPAQPTQEGALGSFSGRGVVVSGSYAYLVSGDLLIADISDLSAPSILSNFATPGSGYGVDISGDTTYVADGHDGLRIVDVADRSDPDETGSLGTSGHASAVAETDGFACVAAEDGGFRVINVSDPTDPFEAGYFFTADRSTDIVVSGEIAYVADRDGGLLILDFAAAKMNGRLIVDKVTNPASDPQSFSFTLSGGPDALQEDHSITDTTNPWERGYLKPGAYSVTETVPNGWILNSATCDDGSDPANIQLAPGETVKCTFTNTKVNTLKADFSASPDTGAPPLIVNFTNLSTGDFDQCLWDFGDGRTRTTCGNPTIKFRQEGHYTVSLTVKGSGGENTKTMEECVNVSYFRVFLPGVLRTK